MTTKKLTAPASLTDEIADVVRQRILNGDYEIGEKIKENLIADELRVSRTPIREAFKILENEGLIDYIPNRGCFSRGFTKQDIDDIYQSREALEELAVKWASERINDEEIKKLEEHCDLMEFYTEREDVVKVLEMNGEFHDIIYNAARSRFLAQVLRLYKEYLDRTRKYINYDREYLAGILQEHRAIMEALKIRNGMMAVAAIKAHMEASQERAEKHWHIKY